MFKNHPKGLFVLALANMGERFGYYTMLAIFVLFMQAKFGFSSDATATIFGTFLALVYFLPLFGGLLADKVLGYGKTIAVGIVVMFIGYFLLAIPTGTSLGAQIGMFGALALIAMGTGCFKGNLQALVGNLYDDPRYSAKRDLAFSIFYMCINIGAFFAPSAAEAVSNHFLGKDNFTYNSSVSSLYHQLEKNEIQAEGLYNLAAIANEQGMPAINAGAVGSALMTAPVDSVSQNISSVFGQVLNGQEIASLNAYADSVVTARYSAVGITGINPEAVKASILDGFLPLRGEDDLSAMLLAIQAEGYKVAATEPKKDEKPAEFTKQQKSSVALQSRRVFSDALNVDLAEKVDRDKASNFGELYTISLSQSYNYGFGVACISLIVSMLIFLGFRRLYKTADKTEKEKAKEAAASGTVSDVKELTPQQTKDRLMALGLVFAVVIFFWMSFHQNGLTMTWFARDYTDPSVSGFNRFGFSLLTLLPFILVFYGILNIVQGKTSKSKLTAATVAVIGAVLAWWAYTTLPETMKITPQIFQQFNPYFIILLTPVTVGTFAWLAKRGKEPLAPRKIGIGMVIAALGFVVLMAGSFGLPVPNALEDTGGVSPMLVSPNWLISTYFVLTIAELFLSPMGISFVSKVAPPKYKGMAQGGWLAATAIGNYLVAIIGYLWGGMQLWVLWAILVACCLLSATFLFSVMKRLEKTTSEA